MDNLGRFLLRFILVPFGYLAAVVAGTLMIVFGSWKLGQMPDPNGPPFAMMAALFAAPVLLITLMSMMWLPAGIGVLLSEGFAIRSWMFHAANGAVTAWIGWNLFGYIDETNTSVKRSPGGDRRRASRRICLLADRRLERRILEAGF
jgi:hypothetical protein